MRFYTQYTKPDNIFEPDNSGQILVESAGYVPAKTMIESMINAGYRLDQFRSGNDGYESDDEAFENEDPTLNPDFDVHDAKALNDEVVERLNSQKEAAEKAAKEAAEKVAIKPEENPA